MLILTEEEVQQTIDISEALELAEAGIRAEGNGYVVGDKFYLPVNEAGFIKPFAGYMAGEPLAFVKIFSYFPANPARHNIPTTTSVVLLFEAETGKPVCLLEADWVTGLKTCASTTITAASLALPESRTAVIFGAGLQGEMHLRALIQRFPLEHISLVDIRIDTAEAVVARLREDLEVDLDVVAIESRKAAVQEADIILTVTTGDMPLIERSWLRQGAFVARLGSYQEVALDVITEADKLIVDRWEYVRDRVPELRQLIERKLLGRDDIHAEWPAIACGRAMGRESTSEIIVFIALGTWGEYAAILPAIYQRAVEMKLGVEVGG